MEIEITFAHTMACITLLSDLGLQDAAVAIARGILLQQHTASPIVDISHEIKPFQPIQAAYLLSTSWQRFAPGTIHIILFDLYSEKTTRVLIAEYQNHFFITPDNTVIPATLGINPPAWLYKELPSSESFPDWVYAASHAISTLLSNKPAILQLPQYQLKTLKTTSNSITGDTITCNVIHIDNYENVTLDITRKRFEEFRRGRPFSLQFVQVEEISDISSSYSDVRPGSKLARFNSNGFLEICVNRGNAASLFGLRIGGKKNEIKITFE